MKPFSDELWESISNDVFPAILEHPFISGLTDGTLPAESFLHYVRQDSAYLNAFGRGLALLAAKADTPETFMMFCEHAKSTVLVEKSLHEAFLGTAEEGVEVPHWHALSPNALLYTSYLMRVAWERPFHEGISAFLPCYWIYRRVGLELVARGSPDPLYQKWIDTYSGEEFGRVVEEILVLVNRVAVDRSAAEMVSMKAHFRRTSQLEWLFWDMGYNRQEWPFPDLS